MRPLILAFVLSVTGGGFGLWRASSEWGRMGDIIGDKIDLAKVQAEVGNAENVAFESTTGSVSRENLAKAETPNGTEFDFGTMLVGTERAHAFRIKNSGNGPLKLWVKGSTCKCTVGSLSKDVLAPGEETEVKLDWKAEGVLDTFSQTATIGTDDPGRLEIIFSITGKLGRVYMLEPPELNFGEFSTYDAFERKAKLYSYEDTPLNLSGYWANLDQSQITLENEIRKLERNEVAEHADARYVADLTVKVAPGLPAGPLNGQVHIEVGKDKVPLSLRCVGTCVSDIRIIGGANYSPGLNSLQMGRIKSEEGGEGKFFVAIRNRDDRPVELKLLRIVPDEAKGKLQVSIGEPVAKPTQTLFPITINVPKGSQAVNYSGRGIDDTLELTFETNLELSKEIGLKVRVIVEE